MRGDTGGGETSTETHRSRQRERGASGRLSETGIRRGDEYRTGKVKKGGGSQSDRNSGTRGGSMETTGERSGLR